MRGPKSPGIEAHDRFFLEARSSEPLGQTVAGANPPATIADYRVNDRLTTACSRILRQQDLTATPQKVEHMPFLLERAKKRPACLRLMQPGLSILR